MEVKPLYKEAYGAAGAFTNVITWACDPGEFFKKAETIAATLDLYVIGVEDEEPLIERTKKFTLSEELEEMAQRAQSNPNAILYGTFHTYPYNEA
ncbi:MAG: hypothetical protein AB7O65_04555 [Candidatus Korobacteraceae bacterium]